MGSKASKRRISGGEAAKAPTCYVIAVPNGAGKTTFALNYLPRIASCHDFINVDEIAAGLSPLDYEAGLLSAGRIFLQLLDKKIAMHKDFAFETTLSGRGYLPKIAEWRRSGWRVVLIYLYLPNADFSAMRVQHRVLQGGHNIPKADILRRYPRSLRNLFDYAEVCDFTVCLDNTNDSTVCIFEKRLGEPMEIHDLARYAMLRKEARNE